MSGYRIKKFSILIKYLKLSLSFLTRGYDRIWNSLIFKFSGVASSTKGVVGRIQIRNKGSLTIGKKFEANSGKMKNPIGGDCVLRIIVSNTGVLNIHNHVGISNSSIVCWEQINIGSFTFIGGGCKIWDTDFHSIDSFDRRHNGDRNIKTAPISIGEYVFIGGSTIILKGVSIGDHSVIAAGSVVTKSIPTNQVWGGNPAKFIRNLNP